MSGFRFRMHCCRCRRKCDQRFRLCCYIVEQIQKGSGTEFTIIWEQTFCEAQKELFLKSEELDEVCRIGKHLGFLDQTQQEQHLKGCAKRLQRMQEQVQKELEEKKRVYGYLWMAAGIFVILVLV